MSIILPRIKAGVLDLQHRVMLTTLPPATLPPAPGADPVLIVLPLRDQIPDGDTWAEEMNARALAHNKPREYNDVWEEFKATGPTLIARVSALTDADLTNPAGLSAVIGQPVRPLICGIYEHYEEHAHELTQIAW